MTFTLRMTAKESHAREIRPHNLANGSRCIRFMGQSMLGSSMVSPFSLAGSLLACWVLAGLPVNGQERQIRQDPIPQASGAFLEKDYRTQEGAWAERCLLKPAQKGWEGKAWAGDATALVKEALALIELESGVGANLGSLAPRFRKLLEASANDPLIAWLVARALKDERLNWRDAQPVLDRVLKRGNTLSGALECHAMQMELSQVSLQGRRCEEENQRLMEALIRAIGDGSYDTEAEAVFVRHQIQFLDLVDASTP
ncbi:MAG: hypothetical protein U0984_02725, partial [Prosthecobacter sp.]|nr:hypothetical protein [Prosthecobacter sp.]